MPSAIQTKIKACDISWISSVALLFGLWMLSSAMTSHGAEFAPVRLGYSTGGNLDYLLEYNKVNDTANLEQAYGFAVSSGVGAETFVWQPWLLQIGSNLGITFGKLMQDQSSNNSFQLNRTGESQYRSVDGGVDFRLLPNSRFPLIARFTRKDSRREIGLFKVVSKELVNQIDVTQSYRTPRGGAGLAANYKRDRRENQLAQIGYLETMRIEGSLLISQEQTLQLTSLRSNEDSGILNRSFNSDLLSARHVYRNSDMSLGTSATRLDTRPGSNLLQYSTVGSWRPRGSALTVNGSVRLFDQLNYASNTRSSFTGANLGANYAVTEWLRINGSISINDTGGEQFVSSSTIGNLSASAQHHFNTLNLLGFKYTRFVTSNVSNSSRISNDSATNTSSSNNSQSASVRLQHGLNGDDVFSFGEAVTTSQDIYVLSTSRVNPRVQLNHRGVIYKNIQKSLIRLSGRDSRDLTGNRTFFQSASLQGSQRENVTSTSALSGNVTVRGIRRGSGTGAGRRTSTSLTSSAALLYRDLKTFNIRDMIFTSNLRVSGSELSEGGLGENPAGSKSQFLWSNKLKYKIGKLQLEAQALWEEANSSNIVRVLFHARREF